MCNNPCANDYLSGTGGSPDPLTGGMSARNSGLGMADITAENNSPESAINVSGGAG